MYTLSHLFRPIFLEIGKTQIISLHVITCRNVATALGFDHRKYNRKYFLNKKNRVKHKLKSYDVKNGLQIEMIANMMSIDRRISRTNRKMSIEDRTCAVIGREQFKLCDNFRNQLCKASNVTKTNHNNKDFNASYIERRATCIQSTCRIFSQRSLHKNKTKAVTMIQKNVRESLCRSKHLTLTKAINIIKKNGG